MVDFESQNTPLIQEPPGSQNTNVTVNVKSQRGQPENPDLRVKLKVPFFYRRTSTRQIGHSFPGIIFPYTPQISYDTKADYATQGPLHSNFTQHFYQRSSVGSINLTAKFTVQNEQEAQNYLATVHLLKSLTKMLTGNDEDFGVPGGSPPPVCRLMAYGSFMIENVPVVVSNMRLEYTDTVDYFTLGKFKGDPTYETASVPTMSTITLNLLPMFSRNEMQQYSVEKWLQGKSEFRKKGFI